MCITVFVGILIIYRGLAEAKFQVYFPTVGITYRVVKVVVTSTIMEGKG